jgi:hypothetical protein
MYSCGGYVQVFETTSENKNLKVDNKYVYENDSIKITYNFWEDKGIMSFSIYNKLNKPLYIDWKKSSYVNNSVKLNYWEDIEISKSYERTAGVTYRSNSNNRFYISNYGGVTNSITSKPEKITFIPPKSNYIRSQFNILPISQLKIKNYTTIQIENLNKKGISDEILEKKLSKSETPLIFRNFITFSFTENFDNEFYVDNEFYISTVLKMKKSQFENFLYLNGSNFYEKDENGRPIRVNPYKKESSFYIKIDQ